jgi:hypothetical protein
MKMNEDLYNPGHPYKMQTNLGRLKEEKKRREH